jgi:hypothetical protein
MSWLPDWLTGYDAENAQRAADADARLRELNELRARDLGDDWYDQVLENYANQEAFGLDAQRAEIDRAAVDSLESSAAASVGFLGNLLNTVWQPIKAILKAIPLWVWLLAGVGLFLYFGGFSLIKRNLPRN